MSSMDTANWMSQLPNPDVSIGSLTIPGTHESATKDGSPYANVTEYIPLFGIIGTVLNDWIKCQVRGIPEQLNDGNRFIDVRVASESPTASHDIPVQHDKYRISDTTLRSVLSDCVAFLRNHSRETILFSLKREDVGSDDGVWWTLQGIIKDLGESFFYMSETIPTLRQAQGKIVLIRRFYLPNGVSDSTGGINVMPFQSGNGTFYIQDYYSFNQVEDKIGHSQKAIESALNEADKTKLYFNFWSGYNAPLMSPYDTAWKVNPAMQTYLLANAKFARNGNTPVKMGINIMDYADPMIVRLLIAANFASYTSSASALKMVTNFTAFIINKEGEGRGNGDKFLDSGNSSTRPYVSRFGTVKANRNTNWNIIPQGSGFNMVRLASIDTSKSLAVDTYHSVILSDDAANSSWFVTDEDCDPGYVRFQWWRSIGSSEPLYLDANDSGKTAYITQHKNKYTQWKVDAANNL